MLNAPEWSRSYIIFSHLSSDDVTVLQYFVFFILF